MLELLHEEAVAASLHKREDGVVVLVHDEVHLPVSKACPVGLFGPLMDAHAVLDVGCPRLMLLGVFPVVFHLVAAVPGKLSRIISPYHGIDGLMGDVVPLLPQPSGYLLGGPLLLGQQLPRTPLQGVADGAVARSAVAAAFCLFLRPEEVITAVPAAVALYLTADGRFIHSNRFRDGFLCTTLLSFHINVVPLRLG